MTGGGPAQGLPLRHVWLVPPSGYLVVFWLFFLYGPVHRESQPGDAQPVSFFSEPSVCLVSGQAYICGGILRLQGLPGTSTIFTTQTVEKAVNWNDI